MLRIKKRMINHFLLNKNQSQYGFSAIGIVMMIFILTLLLLMKLNYLAQNDTQTKALEIKQFKYENIALSALAFGEMQTWQTPTKIWQCRNYVSNAVLQTEKAKTCLKLTSYKLQTYPSIANDDLIQFVILKGEYKNIVRFKLGIFDLNGQLHFTSAHWFDICPDKKGKNCEF